MSAENAFKFFPFNELDPATQLFVKESVRMMDFAYCPYSKFKVGAVVQTPNGKLYTGCNVESLAHTPSICAERTAIVNAVSSGELQISKVAVSGSVDGTNIISPCGVCRQVINEFCPKNGDVIIYCTTSKMDKVLVTSLKQLLPYSFPQ